MFIICQLVSTSSLVIIRPHCTRTWRMQKLSGSTFHLCRFVIRFVYRWLGARCNLDSACSHVLVQWPDDALCRVRNKLTDNKHWHKSELCVTENIDICGWVLHQRGYGGALGWGTTLQTEGRGFYSPWCHWNFRQRYGSEVDSASNRNAYQDSFLEGEGVKAAGA